MCHAISYWGLLLLIRQAERLRHNLVIWTATHWNRHINGNAIFHASRQYPRRRAQLLSQPKANIEEAKYDGDNASKVTFSNITSQAGSSRGSGTATSCIRTRIRPVW